MKKYIIVPEFVPLYAMRKVFGPQTGPIRKPIAVDTEIIRQLLQQKPPVKMYEVQLTNAKLLTYDKKVELTKDNYNKDNFVEESSENTSNEMVEEKVEAELPKLENPINSDSMGVELRVETPKIEEPEKVEEVAVETKSEDADVAELIDVVTAEEPVSVEVAESEEKPTEATDGAADNQNPQRLTKAQRRAMERANRGKAAQQ